MCKIVLGYCAQLILGYYVSEIQTRKGRQQCITL